MRSDKEYEVSTQKNYWPSPLPKPLFILLDLRTPVRLLTEIQKQGVVVLRLNFFIRDHKVHYSVAEKPSKIKDKRIGQHELKVAFCCQILGDSGELVLIFRP